MPHYLDSSYGNVESINRLGDAANNIAIGLPQLRMQAARMQQLMALQKAQEILRQMQTKESQSRSGYYDARAGESTAKTAESLQKTQGMQDAASSADRAGLASTYAQIVKGSQEPTQESLMGAVQMLQGQGLAPTNEFQMQRGDMVNALQALARGAAIRNAASNPMASERMLRPDNIPQGSMAYDVMQQMPLMTNPVVPRAGAMTFEQHQQLQSQKDQAMLERQKAKQPSGSTVEQDLINLMRGGGQAKPATAPKAGARIKVVSKEGVPGTIPAEQLQDALSAGFKQVQ